MTINYLADDSQPQSQNVTSSSINYLAEDQAQPSAPVNYAADAAPVSPQQDTPIAPSSPTQPLLGSMSDTYHQLADERQKLNDAKIQAAYRGVLSFGATLANIGMKGAKLMSPGISSAADKAKGKMDSYISKQEQTFQQNKQQYGGSLEIPKAIGELAGSSILGPAFGAISKAPGIVSGILPRGLQTIGRYATAGLGGSASAGLYGAAKYEPGQEGILNIQRGKEYATNPLAPALGMGGAAAGQWLNRTKQMAETQVKGYGATVLNRDLKPASKDMADMVFGSIPIIGGAAVREKQRLTFIPAIQKFIKTLSSDVAKSTSSGVDTLDSAAKTAIAGAFKRITKAESKIWTPINLVQKQIKLGGFKVQDIKEKATQLLGEHGAEMAQTNPGIVPAIKRLFIDNKKPNPSFEDLKLAKTHISEYLYGKNKTMSRPAYSAVNQFVRGLFDDLDSAIVKVNPKLLEQYHAASAFTASKHEMFHKSGTEFQKAITDNAHAYKFINRLITEKSPTQVRQMLQPFNAKELNTMRAGIINKHLQTSLNPSNGSIDLTKFLGATSQEKNAKEIMGPTYQMLAGLRDAMKPVQKAIDLPNQGMGGSMMRSTQAAMTFGGIAGAVAAPGLMAGVSASVVAINHIANNSPIKNLLINVTRARNNPRLIELMTKKLPALLNRAGLSAMPSENGGVSIKHREDE